MSNQESTPPLQKLNSTVNAPHIDAQHGENHRAQQGHNRPSQRLEKLVAHGTQNEIGGEEDEDGDREELEDDTGYHDVSAGCGVAVDFVGFGGGHATADGLDYEGDDVTGAEDPEVEAGLEDGGFSAEDLDEAA
ncbi:hypothetical protein PENSUB_8723 [Penicillium subrubescens]|uniref:Uncharacterized protein n=1 Tax=Penicillium subrubescens TaxID=1316194 RepID=A0A1Q5TGH8_9EURO|nr:hypothetical protein PENSUB_8723 [Penicillium subrubescens]